MTVGPVEAAKAASSSLQPIKVCLLMESRLSREALIRVLRRYPDVAVVGEGSARRDGGHLAIVESQCDVVVLDICDPKWLHFVLQTARGLLPAFNALLIGMGGDCDQFLAAVRSGVTGYLLKDACPSEIVVAIRALARGEAYCPPQLCSCLFQHVAQRLSFHPTDSGCTVPSFTLRQRKLAYLVAQGLTNKEIASRLNLSEYTIRNHVHRIMRRLKTTNRRELVEAIHVLERQLWRTPIASEGRVQNPDAEIYARKVPQFSQQSFDTAQLSTVQRFPMAIAVRRETRRYKGESQ